jgi:hypothetical protein
MSEYIFSITHGENQANPPHSINFPDDRAAWEEATCAAGEMLRDLDGKLKPGHQWAIEVRRASGDILYRVRVNAEAPAAAK